MSNIDQNIDDLIDEIVDQTLSGPINEELFYKVCRGLNDSGISLLRANMSWGTLHPTIGALSMTWWCDQNEEQEVSRYLHQNSDSDDWLKSPGYYAVNNQIPKLDIPINEATTSPFPLINELRDLGAGHYLLSLFSFSENTFDNDGMFITWACRRKSGFNAQERTILSRVERHIAIALKMALRERIALNTLNAYLGENAAARVLRGAIKLGDGEQVNAVIWFSDLRGSTELGDTLPGAELLDTLNEYFQCSAGAIQEQGGEILRFIGDAVLAIFPAQGADLSQACHNATKAALSSREKLKRVNQDRCNRGKAPIEFGLGLHVGELMFGNIGIPERLDFAVTGPAANEAARIEAMTKTLPENVLASSEFVRHIPDYWQTAGAHNLRGVARRLELYSLK